MEKINTVIAGDYVGSNVCHLGNGVWFAPDFDVNHNIEINKGTIESYAVVDEKHQKSATSAVGRAVVGGVLLGGFGLFAGLTAKNKRTFTVEILFKDGKKSLALLNDKVYAALMKVLF